MIHDLFPNKVFLDESTHTYKDTEGRQYISFSRCLNEFLCAKFDKDNIARFVARKEGATQEDVIYKWDRQRDEGTRLDNTLTKYAQTGLIDPQDEDLHDVVKMVLEKYGEFHRTYEQIVVYNESLRTAGSLDKLGIISNRKTSGFKLYDFKRFEGGMSYESKGQKWLNYPFDHLLNSKYNKISIQLSFYAWHLEQLTGRQCEGLFIDVIQPIIRGGMILEYKNYLVPVNYQKHQIWTFLSHNKERIIKLMDEQPLPVTVGYDF